jgi:Protein of unknown function (DUF2917)
MNSHILPSNLRLEHQATYTVADAAGVQLACSEGTVWVTLDGDLNDYILEAGDSFVTQEHRRALVYAIAPARISLEARNSRKPTMATFSRFHAIPFMKAAR